MILFNYHKLQGTHQHPEKSYNWQFDSTKYTVEQIVSMTKWITNKKADYTVAAKDNQVNTVTFSKKQQLAYDIIVNHNRDRQIYYSDWRPWAVTTSWRQAIIP